MPTITRLDGWHGEERDGDRTFRWIDRDAHCRVSDLGAEGPLYLRLVAAQPLSSESSRLSVLVNGRSAGECAIGFHAARYLFPLGTSGLIDLTLSLDKVRHAPGDTRALGAIVHALDILDVSQLKDPVHGDGWYECDDEDYFSSRWMGLEARLLLPPGYWRRGRFAALPVYGDMEYGEQVLTVECGGQQIVQLPLLPRWHVYDFAVPDDVRDRNPESAVTLRLNRSQPAHLHPGEVRDLGIRVGTLEVHDTRRRYEQCRVLHDFCVSMATGAPADVEDRDRNAEEEQAAREFVEQNAALNAREFRSGATVLTSFAPNLGIDLYGKCNIKPPCVYCQWDVGKGLEGDDVTSVVDDRTLEDYGPFFRAARTLVNCSIGEPLLHPRLPQVLQMLTRYGKGLEMATNGQAFSPAAIRALAGRNIVLFASLDAATSATYARLRNDRWPEVLSGLIAFREAQLRAHGLPQLWVVFMPMRANLHDLEACVRLCRMVNASRLVLRSLIRFEHTDVAADRGGYHFDYVNELLTARELEAVVERSLLLGRQHGIEIDNQLGVKEGLST